MSTYLGALKGAIVDRINDKFYPKPKKEVSFSGKLWSNYTEIVKNSEPTSFKAVNMAARAIFAILAFAPYTIATVGTLLADATVMTARGISNAYRAIRNRFSKPELSKMGKALEFVKKNKNHILASMAVISFVGVLYLGTSQRKNIAALGNYGIDKLKAVRDEFRARVDAFNASHKKPEPTTYEAWFINPITNGYNMIFSGYKAVSDKLDAVRDEFRARVDAFNASHKPKPSFKPIWI